MSVTFLSIVMIVLAINSVLMIECIELNPKTVLRGALTIMSVITIASACVIASILIRGGA